MHLGTHLREQLHCPWEWFCGKANLSTYPLTPPPCEVQLRSAMAFPSATWERARSANEIVSFSRAYRRSAQEPAEVRGPSTPPMLPRFAQDDSLWFFGAIAPFHAATHIPASTHMESVLISVNWKTPSSSSPIRVHSRPFAVKISASCGHFL